MIYNAQTVDYNVNLLSPKKNNDGHSNFDRLFHHRIFPGQGDYPALAE
jgi:hypothetical protein